MALCGGDPWFLNGAVVILNVSFGLKSLKLPKRHCLYKHNWKSQLFLWKVLLSLSKALLSRSLCLPGWPAPLLQSPGGFKLLSWLLSRLYSIFVCPQIQIHWRLWILCTSGMTDTATVYQFLETASTNVCSHSNISVLQLYSIYHTCFLVWFPNISSIPLRPPTLCSTCRPLTWL